jgi:hypothetical protein
MLIFLFIASFTPVAFVTHPSMSYKYFTLKYDYAIITLATDVSFNISIAPICLPIGAGTIHENK